MRRNARALIDSLATNPARLPFAMRLAQHGTSLFQADGAELRRKLSDALVGLQRRPAHAKPDFNWLSGPRNGTWKCTCGISCLRSLAPMWRLRCSTIQATFTNPSLLRATPHSATPCHVLIQLPDVIDTISKRWRSKKAFNTSPSHCLLHPVLNLYY